MTPLLVLLLATMASLAHSAPPALPVVLNTWPFTAATARAFETLSAGARPVDALVAGATVCEQMQCDGTVGFGGSPDTNGETTLDSMVMDGDTIDVGAVGNLRGIKEAAGTALAVLRHTKHTLLSGDQAAQFAEQMGFHRTNLSTPHSEGIFRRWQAGECQPNFYLDTVPPANSSCGPYAPAAADAERVLPRSGAREASPYVTRTNHDTIGLVALDASGSMAAATSTNGADHKVAGRIGDSPIMGAGAYADSRKGACAATGDGDTMMRFLPCFAAVQGMGRGESPTAAAEAALRSVAEFYPDFTGALVTLSASGAIGAAGYNWNFTYAYQRHGMSAPVTVAVPPLNA